MKTLNGLQQFSVMLAVVALVTTSGDAWAAGAFEKARAQLQGGNYKTAEKAFRALTSGQTARPAWLGLGRVLLETGRYHAAIKAAKRAAGGKQWAAAKTLQAEVQREIGNRAGALKTLKAVIRRHKKHYRALALMGLIYHEQGKTMLAKATFDTFYDDYGGDVINKKSAEQLTYVAMACRYTDNFRDASDVFSDATKVDPKHVEAFIQWAEISLEKYEAGYAEQHYKSALKVNPHHARALIGLARVVLEQANDVRKAEKLLKKALQTNPHSIEAKVVQARMLVDNEEYKKGEALLGAVLQRDGRHLGALTMLATSYFLRDNRAGFAKIKKKVFAINPRYMGFYHMVVKIGVRHHRYAEAINLGHEALKIVPDDPYVLADLGTNYVRLGDDQQGLKYLKLAWQGDKYNVRNYNLLNLFDDDIAKDYQYTRTKHFRLRVHKQDKALIRRLIAPELEKAFVKYQKKYRFTPKLPVTVEFFRDPKHYAVRTVGLPGLAALGVCFGPVITTTSPMNGRFNWGQVLWHELNHVFTIQLSRSRVPRWFTEGLADMEPMLNRKEWKRENDFDIYKALRSGQLHGLASMNSAFTRARSLQEIVVAYYQGSLMAIYLVKHWGLPKVISALRGYGRGLPTEKVLPTMTGMSLAQLDARFRAAELNRLAHYNHNWFVDWSAYEDLDARRAKAKASPGDADAQAAYGAALFVKRKAKPAAAAVERALKRAPQNKLALFVAAQIALGNRKQKEAVKHLKQLITAGGDGYEARLALGQIALHKKKLADAKRHLDRAKKLDPERGQPYYLLQAAYHKAGKIDEAIAELKKLAPLQQQRFGPIAKLVQLLAKRKDYAGVRKYGQMAYYIQPASVKLHVLLAEAYAAKAPGARLNQAVWHLETALMTKPSDKGVLGDLHLRMAKLQLKRGDKRAARAHYEKAKKADPDMVELDAVRKQL